MTVAFLAPWQKRGSDGCWHRKLVGAEKMFEDWLSIDGWVEWVASVKFSDDTLTQESIESVFMSAVASLALERPSIIASIERTDQGPSFVFNPIADMAYLHTRVSQIANVVQVDDTLESGVTTITDQFYAETDKRISIELGPSLMQLTMVRSSLSKEAGKYAILLRSHHSLNDFLSGMAMFDGILSKIAKRKGPDVSLLSSTEDRLHPCYIDLLREPVDHYTSTEAETAKASEIMGKQMANITIWPNKQEPAQETSTTDYAVKRKTFTEETTSKLVSVCKKHGVTVTALLLAIQTVAVLMTFPPDDENRTEAILNLVSNRLTKTTLFDVTMDETEVTSNGSNADTRSTARRRAQKAATTGPIMATNFVLAPCDVGVYVDAKKQYGTEDAWRKCIWQVANSVKKTIQNTASQNFTEKAYWTEGPTGFGIIAMALSAMKSGAAPVAPGVFTSLSAPGVLDDVHLLSKYGDSLVLEDVAFFPRVSTYFGGQTWAWTALGKLNTIVVRPDPRKCKSEKTEWWDLNNAMIEEIALNTI